MIRNIIITLVALIAGAALLQFVASESGEVVVLSTLDAQGQAQETRLWVVDHEGHQYLRSGAPNATWFARLKGNNRVGVDRAGRRAAYDAYPDASLRDEINDLMREKYGWADQVIEMFFGRDDATPIRLEIFHEYADEELPPELRPIEE